LCVLKTITFFLHWENAPACYNASVAVVNSEVVGLAPGLLILCWLFSRSYK
jgi:hypothetical protein